MHICVSHITGEHWHALQNGGCEVCWSGFVTDRSLHQHKQSVEVCEGLFRSFIFSSLWPQVTPQASEARRGLVRFRSFLKDWVEKGTFLLLLGQSADTGWSAGWIDCQVSGPLIAYNLGGMWHKFVNACICYVIHTASCARLKKGMLLTYAKLWSIYRGHTHKSVSSNAHFKNISVSQCIFSQTTVNQWKYQKMCHTCFKSSKSVSKPF